MKKPPRMPSIGPVFIRALIGFHLFYGNWGRLYGAGYPSSWRT